MRPVVRRVDRLQRLAVFESAARLGSFTAAGRELGIAQPAVTRQIRALEDHLGAELFLRSANRSELTDAGQRLRDGVDVGFTAIEHALVEIEADDVFVLAAPPGFSQQVIVSRLDELQDVLGDRDLRLWLYDRDGELGNGTFDAAIRLGAEPWPGYEMRALFPERVMPVATPAAAATWGLHATSSAADVLSAPLLHMDAADRPWMSWADWLGAFDLTLSPGRKRIMFNNYPTVLQQAIAGRGVALGWEGLIEDLLESEVLTVVGPTVSSERSYHVTWPSRRQNATVRALVDWFDAQVVRA